jgi:uncharacterized membrane protein
MHPTFAQIQGDRGMDALLSNPVFWIVVLMTLLIFLVSAAASGKNLEEKQTSRQTGWDQIDDSAVETGKAKGDAAASKALLRFKGATKE